MTISSSSEQEDLTASAAPQSMIGQDRQQTL
jgi:hypothetical protein